MSDEHSDRVIVSQDNLARCKWCGTPESPIWTISQSENLYCTPECMLADEASIKRLGGIIFMVLGVLSTIPYIATPFLFPGSVGADNLLIVTGMAFLVIGIAQYAESRKGQKYMDRKDRYRGVSPIICSYCSHQNSPHFTACQNCGAPLTEASFAEESLPPWLHTTSGVVRCPYCAAFQSYRQVQGTQERLVFCQNCSRLFRPSRQAHVVR
ncbi:MAG: hypothetical protein ACFFEX_03070 [Candidatus Thorarchaeota archaeon]